MNKKYKVKLNNEPELILKDIDDTMRDDRKAFWKLCFNLYKKIGNPYNITVTIHNTGMGNVTHRFKQ